MFVAGPLNVLSCDTEHSGVVQAIQFIQKSNHRAVFERIEIGKSERVAFSGEDYAIYQVIMTKPKSEFKMESHRKFIDVQYIFDGAELFRLDALEKAVNSTEYDAVKDIQFHNTATHSSLILTAGWGCVLFPDDLHAPGLATGEPAIVRKIVVKVAVKR